ANATRMSARLINSASTSGCDARVSSSIQRDAVASHPGGVTLPTIASNLVDNHAPLAGSGGSGFNPPRNCLTYKRDQRPPIFDGVLERIEATDQKGRNPKIVVGQQRVSDLLGGSDQCRGIPACSGGSRDRGPKPLVEDLALGGRCE